MAHLLANNPGQQDAGEILLSGFTHMALQMEAQRRLTKPGSKPRRGKKGPKKQPQRGLGVAQLEKIRLEEQRRASQHVQHLAALRQLHTAPPLFSSSNAGMQAPASIIPQLERENSNHHASSLILHTNHPPMSSSLAHYPCVDTVATSYLLNNVSPVLSSTARLSAPATPLNLFPTEKLAAAAMSTKTTTAIKVADSILPEKCRSLRHVLSENRDFVEFPHSSLNLAYDQSNEGGQDQSYSLPHMRRNCMLFPEIRNSGSSSNQVPNRMTSPSISLDRMVELSSFQSAAASSRGGDPLGFSKRRAWGAGQQPGAPLSELPTWGIPSLAHSKTSHEQEIYCRSEEVCELTLRPPGTGNGKSVKEDPNGAPTSAHGRGPHSFLSLSVGATWEDSIPDASSSTPSPVSATTKTTTTSTTSTTDEYTSPLATNMPCPTNFFFKKSHLSNELQNSLLSTFDVNLDLTLKL